MTESLERRRSERHPVSMPATAVSLDGVTRIAATILDMSRHGARLALAEPAALAKRFYLLIPDHNLQPCTLVWRSQNEVGVAYAS